MSIYKIKHTSIIHNGTVYKEGSTIELTKEEAKRLEDFVDILPNASKPKTETKTQNNTKTTQNSTKTKTENKKSETKVENKVETKEGNTENDK